MNDEVGVIQDVGDLIGLSLIEIKIIDGIIGFIFLRDPPYKERCFIVLKIYGSWRITDLIEKKIICEGINYIRLMTSPPKDEAETFKYLEKLERNPIVKDYSISEFNDLIIFFDNMQRIEVFAATYDRAPSWRVETYSRRMKL